MIPAQGEIWWAETPEGGRRPILVITRNQAIPVMRTVLVAPITRTVRGIATEISLDSDDGLREECVAVFDNVQPVPRWSLTERVGHTGPGRRNAICRALQAMADC